MILFISVSVFLALSMVALAVFWWSSARQESLDQRFREVIGPAGDVPSSTPARAWERISRLWERSDPLTKRSGEIVARVTGRRTECSRVRPPQGERGHPSPEFAGPSSAFAFCRPSR